MTWERERGRKRERERGERKRMYDKIIWINHNSYIRCFIRFIDIFTHWHYVDLNSFKFVFGTSILMFNHGTIYCYHTINSNWFALFIIQIISLLKVNLYKYLINYVEKLKQLSSKLLNFFGTKQKLLHL